VSVDRWRDIVQAEISRIGVPLPADLPLAVMKRESGGVAGAVNPSSGASGLMQVMPIALQDYNQNHSQQYTMSQLRGKDSLSAKIQIRVGLWILQRFIRGAYNYLKKRLGEVALDDLIRIADTFYAAGPGTAKKRLNKLPNPTWTSVKSTYPKWDRVGPAELVWESAKSAPWDLQSIDQWLESNIQKHKKTAAAGAIAGLLIILVMWYYLKRKK